MAKENAGGGRATENQRKADMAVRAEYDKYDRAFRDAKRQGDFRRASQYKQQRDALESRVNEAIRRTAR
jgi:hypothetical protein